MKKLNKEEQRAAIAEACGWVWASHEDFHGTKNWGWEQKGESYHMDDYYKSDKLMAVRRLPDYLNDLNAMHEAEKVLTEEQVHTYCTILFHCVDEESKMKGWLTIHATAAQRAEAFLKTLNLWKDYV